jgi:adenine-specific DNA-methyltransferase
LRTRDDVSPDKLRGGFYSPEVLVKLCFDRLHALLNGRSNLRLLEPAAGDGAFIRGLASHGLSSSVQHVEAIELIGSEASKAEDALVGSGIPGRVCHMNVLEWYAEESEKPFDAVVANPPYVRFQFIDDVDKQRAKDISSQLGITGSSVSNLWIPVFLLALDSLKVGGAFSVILPTEFLTGVSASHVRSWLLNNTSELSIDLFKPGSFPAVLQEVLVLTGRRIPSGINDRTITFHDHNGGTHSWSHVAKPEAKTWTSYLLNPEEHSAFRDVQQMDSIKAMRSIAKFSVSTVTGANNYFCLPSDEITRHELETWALPLLARSRHAKGLTFTEQDHQELAAGSVPAWILGFSAGRADPIDSAAPSGYIARGEDQNIHTRYKTRIRTPWYRVPIVPAADLLLSKRSNQFPRVISNHAGAITTDTIYKGQMLAGAGMTADDVTAGFHNSLTLLSAEIEGRSFGGGVLELVPSEVASLLVPTSNKIHLHLDRLDSAYRSSGSGEGLIEDTNNALASLIPDLTDTLMDTLRSARESLLNRRMQRTSSSFYEAQQ